MEQWLRSIAALGDARKTARLFAAHRVTLEQIVWCADSAILLALGVEPADALHILHAASRTRRLPTSHGSTPRDVATRSSEAPASTPPAADWQRADVPRRDSLHRAGVDEQRSDAHQVSPAQMSPCAPGSSKRTGFQLFYRIGNAIRSAAAAEDSDEDDDDDDDDDDEPSVAVARGECGSDQRENADGEDGCKSEGAAVFNGDDSEQWSSVDEQRAVRAQHADGGGSGTKTRTARRQLLLAPPPQSSQQQQEREINDGDAARSATPCQTRCSGDKAHAVFIDLDKANVRVIAEPVALASPRTDGGGAAAEYASSGAAAGTYKERLRDTLGAGCELLRSPARSLTRDCLFELCDAHGMHFFARVCADGRTKGVSVSDAQTILNKHERLAGGVRARMRMAYAMRFGNRYLETRRGGGGESAVLRCVYPDRLYMKTVRASPQPHLAAASYAHIFQVCVLDDRRKMRRCRQHPDSGVTPRRAGEKRKRRREKRDSAAGGGYGDNDDDDDSSCCDEQLLPKRRRRRQRREPSPHSHGNHLSGPRADSENGSASSEGAVGSGH